MKTLACLLGLAIGLSAQTDDAGAIRDRLDKYLLDYEPQLSALVAEELLIQRDAPGPGAAVNAAPDTKHRRLTSEVAFIGLPGDAGWLGFRRVVMVNGKTIADAGPPLADAAHGRSVGRLRPGQAAAAGERAPQPRIAAHHQPAQPAAGVPAPAQPAPPAPAHRCGRESSRHRDHAAGAAGALVADDHPATRRRRHAEPGARLGGDQDRPPDSRARSGRVTRASACSPRSTM